MTLPLTMVNFNHFFIQLAPGPGPFLFCMLFQHTTRATIYAYSEGGKTIKLATSIIMLWDLIRYKNLMTGILRHILVSIYREVKYIRLYYTSNSNCPMKKQHLYHVIMWFFTVFHSNSWFRNPAWDTTISHGRSTVGYYSIPPSRVDTTLWKNMAFASCCL
jgi:hypothetical protein